jgi:hypothetical protein
LIVQEIICRYCILVRKKLESIDFIAKILAELSVKYDDLKTPIEIIEVEVILESQDLNAQVLSIGVKKGLQITIM